MIRTFIDCDFYLAEVEILKGIIAKDYCTHPDYPLTNCIFCRNTGWCQVGFG